jgi:hypothetical protein
MIDALRAVGWLNAIDHSSRLNNETRRLIREAYQYRLDDVRLSLIVERLRNVGHGTGDPLEKAEILLWCASIGCYRHTWSPPAARDASEAVILYDCDDHRQAVALWILGIIQWEMSKNHEAYRNWRQAREFFRRRQVLFQYHPNEKEWYRDREWEMDLELLARPEEIACWLNHFEASSLRPATQQLVDRVRQKARHQAYSNVFALIQDLQEANQRSQGFHETAELHLEFGLAVYQLRNWHAAIAFLRNAVRDFYPGSGIYHKQVVARCMLGAMEWLVDSAHKQAYQDWKLCLEELENLRWWADGDHCQEKVEWYARRCDLLRAALLERVEPENGSGPHHGPLGGGIPWSQPPSNPGKTDLYEELLAMVEWDHSIADRLIEYERKLAPAANRDELIRRAIERRIRDNL